MDLKLVNRCLETSKSIFLVTDLVEKENFVSAMIEGFVEEHPECFNCNTKCVYTALNYASLQKDDYFLEIKRIQDAVNKAARLKGEYEGIIALDFTEYLKKEEEYFFPTILKFLHDMQKNYNWRFIFLVTRDRATSEHDLTAMFKVIAHYFRVQKVEEVLSNKGALLVKEKIKLPFLKYYSPEALELLAEKIDANVELTDSALLKNLTDDIRLTLDVEQITQEVFQKYTSMEGNLFEILETEDKRCNF